MEQIQSPSALIFLTVTVSLIPFLAVMTTSFVKLAVVFSLLRNALGVQQIPPNMAIYGLAVILTVYVMSPMGVQIKNIIEEEQIDFEQPEEILSHWDQVSKPYRDFLYKYTTRVEREFFVKTAKVMWPEEEAKKIDERSFLVIIPAFTVSELTEAFQIGFLLYLPFIVIDLIVSNILLAMGMMMVSPMTISLPFKLLLFVIVDGWARLVHGLVLTYA